MKKGLLFVLVVALMCAPFAVLANATPEKKESGPIVLDFPTWQAEEAGFADFWKKVIPEYEAQHPNVKINISQIPFSQFTDTLITRYSAGDAPDITHIATRFFDQFASQGWFENLDPYFEGTDILSDWTGLQDAMLVDGNQQGLVLMGYGFVLYYNEAILKKAGVSVPTTVAELRAAVDKINALKDADISAFGTTTTQHNNAYNDFANFIYGAGHTIVKDGKFYLNTPEVVAAVKDYNYVVSNAPAGVTTEMLRQLFVDGKVAMMIDGPFVAPLIEKADADLKPTLKIARVPFKQIPGTISNSLHIAKDLPKERKQLAFDFIKIVAEKENQILYTQYTKNPSGRMSVASAITDPNTKYIFEMSAEAVNTLPASKNLSQNYSKYTSLAVEYILQLQKKGANVEAVLRAMENAMYSNSLEP